MPSKKRVPTKFDRQRNKEDVKLLVFTGNHSVREAARLVGVNEATALTWAAEDKWSEQIQRIKELAGRAQSGSITAENVAFDLAATNKQSRAALVQIHNLTVMEQLRQVAEKPGRIVVETPQDLKALTESTAKVAGDWDEVSGNRYAVSLNLSQILQGVRVIPAGEEAIVVSPASLD